ncbi:MAG: division/cell wall cluster transcriptional repressor MraZ [Dysgonamonadaceae bacterium]|jgi:MraZ protein|nr:division/cell wall cluster transcriptional repressor MraZ [Dysgonamonadaceae bacterium]
MYEIMDRFIGNIDAKTDVKGRVFIPAAFRKILQTAVEVRLILRKDIHQDCLVLFPASAWERELTYLRSKLNKYDEEQQQFYRQYILDSEIVEMDSSGRILIPKRYLQMAGITGEVRFVGIDDTIEIWSRGKLEKPLIDPETFKSNIHKYLIN